MMRKANNTAQYSRIMNWQKKTKQPSQAHKQSSETQEICFGVGRGAGEHRHVQNQTQQQQQQQKRKEHDENLMLLRH